MSLVEFLVEKEHTLFHIYSLFFLFIIFTYLFQLVGNSRNGTGKTTHGIRKKERNGWKGTGGYSTEHIAEQLLVKLKSLRKISCWFEENPCDSSIKWVRENETRTGLQWNQGRTVPHQLCWGRAFTRLTVDAKGKSDFRIRLTAVSSAWFSTFHSYYVNVYKEGHFLSLPQRRQIWIQWNWSK